MIVAVLSLIFSMLFIYYSRNTGNSFWLHCAPFFLAAAAYSLQPHRRRRKGTVRFTLSNTHGAIDPASVKAS
jgi:hypothetical protein